MNETPEPKEEETPELSSEEEKRLLEQLCADRFSDRVATRQES
jgi:hypothetical protein